LRKWAEKIVDISLQFDLFIWANQNRIGEIFKSSCPKCFFSVAVLRVICIGSNFLVNFQSQLLEEKYDEGDPKQLSKFLAKHFIPFGSKELKPKTELA
jgi:hypothetical protein